MRILVLDDDRALRTELTSFLTLNGHEACAAASLGEARAILAGSRAGGGAGARVDLLLADLYLGKEVGIDILKDSGRLPVIMISGAGGIREAVAALKAGAWDFLEKPVDPDRLLGLLRNLDRGLAAERGMAALRETWLAEHAAFAPGSPFGAALAEAGKVAPSPLSVLVTGPSGSGKEVVARWIHYCSSRSGGPFVAVNCATIPPELAEAAFFGARRGAYTGAESDRQGWFQAADGGTLFLDEVGDIAQSVQAKLLRAVESGEVQRLGGTVSEKLSVRLVSATNRDLRADCGSGRFREDLFWRLAQATIRLPSLAERREDIPHLARFFLERSLGEGFAGAKASSAGASLDGGALAWLEAREWPGNVRELRAFVERALWLSPGPVIGRGDLEDLERSRPQGGVGRDQSPAGAATIAGVRPTASLPRLPLREAKLAFERDYVEGVLSACGGSVAVAAASLGLLPNNLSRKLKELGLKAGRGD